MTRTLDEIREENQLLTNKLAEMDLPAEPYKKGPLGNNNFCISIDRQKRFRVWLGQGEYAFDTNPNHQQMVLSVTEAQRRIPATIATHSNRPTKNHLKSEARHYVANFSNNWNVEFVEWVPCGRTTGCQISDVEQIKHDCLGNHRAKIVAIAPPEKNHLLVGRDETDIFIAGLPKQVKTVEQAHEVLRPPTVDDGELRQGEWYFVPVPEEEQRDFEIRAEYGMKCGVPLERNSSHHAASRIRYGSEIFVRGYIYDNRVGHHKPLFLTQWHRAVRNREVRPQVESKLAARARYWD